MSHNSHTNLWSSPRNVSTALMYSLAQHPDVTVVDEPLYAHYLVHQQTAAAHPFREKILAEMESDGDLIIEKMLDEEHSSSHVVFKQMTHHLVELSRDFLNRMSNVLLIRDPRAILRSFGEVVEDVTAADIGVPQQFELFHQLRASGHLTAVVDARLLLLDPPRVLRQLCDRLGLAYTDALLRWPAGPRPEDGVWAPAWYANVHRSTGFQPYRERTFTLPPRLEEIAVACRPAYEAMLAEALR